MRFLYLMLSVTFLSFYSCGKKWKKPTDVSFKFQLNSNSNSGPLKFTNAYFVINKVSFKGERGQGTKEVSLEQKFSSNMPIYFSQDASGSGIKFDVPQGTYSQIEIKLETSTDPSGTALQVNGTYLDSSGNNVAVQFTFSAADITDIMAKNSNGGNEIALVAGQPATVTIIMNPVYWFAPVSESMLDDAGEEIENGVSVIQINKDKNQDIYNLIVNRIKDGNDAVFN